MFAVQNYLHLFLISEKLPGSIPSGECTQHTHSTFRIAASCLTMAMVSKFGAQLKIK